MRYIVSNGYQTDTAFFTIQIASLPNTSLGNDVVMCDGDRVVLDAGGLGELFDWGGGFVVNDSTSGYL
ncbi:MAG: hypothetical protein IPG07_03310 [Crocinitomicaceae bacterium]|nr:hypothetical protein [Crocinitomicaceae bacterium]